MFKIQFVKSLKTGGVWQTLHSMLLYKRRHSSIIIANNDYIDVKSDVSVTSFCQGT